MIKSILLNSILILLSTQFLNAQVPKVISNLWSGNWSDTTIWRDSKLPQGTDIVYLTSDIIIDKNVTCYSLNTNGYNVTVRPGVMLSVVGAPHQSGNDSLAIFNIPTLPGKDTLQATSIINGIEYFFFGTRDPQAGLKYTRVQYQSINDRNTVVNQYFDDSMNVKAMYFSLNGTNDTSFYKFTYQDTIVFVTRFHIDWSTNTYTVREITASKESGSFHAPLGITQLDNNFVNGDIGTTALAAMKSGAASVITVAAGIAVGWIAAPALGLTAATSAAIGGVLALAAVYSDANASTTPYQEIKQPKPSKREYEKLIEQNPILDSANWYGTSSPFVMTTGAKPKGETGVTVSGTLLANGGAHVKAQGICWNAKSGLLPTLSDKKIQVVAGAGLFSIDVVDLSPDTTYYFRTFATNSFGTSYGQVRSFKPTGTPDSITRMLIEHGTWNAYFYAEEDSTKDILGKRVLTYWSDVCPNTPTSEYIFNSIEFKFFSNGKFFYRDYYGDRWYDLNESNCTSTPSSPMTMEWDEEEFSWQYLPNERIIRAQQDESGGYSYTLDFKVISFVNKELVLDIYYEECSPDHGCTRGYDGRIKLK